MLNHPISITHEDTIMPKKIRKIFRKSPRPTHHPPKTFWRVLGIVGGQDLVCRLPIVQGTSAHSFDPPPLTLSLVEGGTENFN